MSTAGPQWRSTAGLIGPGADLVILTRSLLFELIRSHTPFNSMPTRYTQDTQVTAQFPSDSPLCDPFVGICSAQLEAEPLRRARFRLEAVCRLLRCQRLQRPKGCSPIPGKNGNNIRYMVYNVIIGIWYTTRTLSLLYHNINGIWSLLYHNINVPMFHITQPLDSMIGINGLLDGYYVW